MKINVVETKINKSHLYTNEEIPSGGNYHLEGMISGIVLEPRGLPVPFQLHIFLTLRETGRQGLPSRGKKDTKRMAWLVLINTFPLHFLERAVERLIKDGREMPTYFFR